MSEPVSEPSLPPDRIGWDRVWILLRVELGVLLRERLSVLSVVVMMVVLGAGGTSAKAALDDLLADADDEADVVPPTWDCQPGALPSVATTGDVPAWLAWPDPFVAADAADVLLRFGPALAGEALPVEVVALTPDARVSAARSCVWSRVRDERRARLDGLGVSEDPRDVVTVTTLPPGLGSRPTPTLSVVGSSIALGLGFLLLSLFLDLGPRARASGWLETWLSLPGQRGDLVFAWWALGVTVGGVGTALILLGHVLHAVIAGTPIGSVPWGLFPSVLVAASAIGVRVYVDIPDMRTALVQSMPVMLLGGAAVGIANLLEGYQPGLGAAMPLAGLALALLGLSSAHVLAMVTGLLGAFALLLDAVRVLEGLVVRAGAQGRTAGRRARGNYLPEVAVLALVAIAGVGAWAPPALLLSDVPTRTLISQAVFLLGPALFVATPLRLDRAPLLSWRPPPVRAWLALPVLLPGTLLLGTLVFGLAHRLFPDDALLGEVSAGFAAFDNPWGLFVISVVPGVCEELLFRGAIFGLLRRGMPTWAALLVQAALFAFLHGLAVRLPGTFALGVVFGLLALRTGSLWPGILAHAAHNLAASLLGAELFAWAEHPATWGVVAISFGAGWVILGRGPPGGARADGRPGRDVAA